MEAIGPRLGRTVERRRNGTTPEYTVSSEILEVNEKVLARWWLGQSMAICTTRQAHGCNLVDRRRFSSA